MIKRIYITYYSGDPKNFQDASMVFCLNGHFTCVSIAKRDIRKVIERHIKKPVFTFSINDRNPKIKSLVIARPEKNKKSII